MPYGTDKGEYGGTRKPKKRKPGKKRLMPSKPSGRKRKKTPRRSWNGNEGVDDGSRPSNYPATD